MTGDWTTSLAWADFRILLDLKACSDRVGLHCLPPALGMSSWGQGGHFIISAAPSEHVLHFQACESRWLHTCRHEQYFVSACHWEHFHMLISINNACPVICLVFFPSLFLAGGWHGPEMSSRETASHLHSSFQGGLVGWVLLLKVEGRAGQGKGQPIWGHTKPSCSVLAAREMPLSALWWHSAVAYFNLIWLFTVDSFKSSALGFSGYCWARVNPPEK